MGAGAGGAARLNGCWCRWSSSAEWVLVQVEQLGWILADNRDALVAVNVALLALVAAAVALVARSRRVRLRPPAPRRGGSLACSA